MNYTTIAIIGRPNVGKSSLFNALVGARKAIVDDMAGVTVDRNYSYANFNDRQFILIDTGGYTDSNEQPLQNMLNSQVMMAIDESDIILFVVDAKEGLIALDQEIADKLRKLNKRLILIANKSENLDPQVAKGEFYGLSDNIIATSVAHRHGMEELKQTIINLCCKDIIQEPENQNPTLAVIGRPNAGKSTLTNTIIGRNQVLVSDIPGTTRDSIYLDFTFKDKPYGLIDTAGLRRKSRIAASSIERYSVLRSMKAIVDADVVALLIDATLEISDQDCRLFNHVKTIGRPLIIILNKWDLLDTYKKNMIKKNLEFKLRQITHKDIVTCTATEGYGVSRILELFVKKNLQARTRISTASINKLLKTIIEEHPPAMKSGKRPKISYAHIAGYKPHKIIIHGARLDYLSEDYKRYLVGTLQTKLKLHGIPISLIFKEKSANE